MANIKSAKKRVLVNQTKAARNKSRNSAMKTAIKRHTLLLKQTQQIRKQLSEPLSKGRSGLRKEPYSQEQRCQKEVGSFKASRRLI